MKIYVEWGHAHDWRTFSWIELIDNQTSDCCISVSGEEKVESSIDDIGDD